MEESKEQLVQELESLQGQVAELEMLRAECERVTNALRKSEERYRRLVASVTDYVYTVEIKGGRPVATRHGPGCVTVTGYTAEDYAADRYLWHRMVYEDDKEAVTEHAARVLSGERVSPLEHRIVHKNGSIRWVRNTPVRRYDDQGRLIAYDGLITDITGHKRAEEARLREKEAEARAQAAEAARLELEKEIAERKRAEESLNRRVAQLALINDIGKKIAASLDLDEVLHRAARLVQASFGYHHVALFIMDRERGELAMRAKAGQFAHLFPPDHRIKIGQGLVGWVGDYGARLLANDVRVESRYTNFYPDVIPTLSELGVPILVGEEVVGVIDVQSPQLNAFDKNDVMVLETLADQIAVAIENVRLAKQAAEIEVLRELDRLRSELIANVSHELRTPLGLIKVFGTTLLREDVSFDRETQREFLSDIKQEADKLERTVDNLLDLSRIQNGRLRLDKRPTDMGVLVSQVMKTLEVQLTPRHYFVHDFPPEPLEATVDPKRIEEVLRNLLSNAIKYSPAGGAITVHGRRDQQRLQIQVSDQGIGIPPQDLEKVFERFYRVENEVTQQVRGVGLGLPVCRGIVEAHGGRLWAESTLGERSTFHFTLPIGDEPDPFSDLVENRSVTAQTKGGRA